MIFPAATVALIGGILVVRLRDGHRSPMMLALGVWGVSLLLASPILFRYQVSYSLAADLLVALCLSAATVAYVMVRHAPRPAPQNYLYRSKEIRCAKFLGWAGVFGCLLLLADAHAHSGLQFSLGYLVTNLSNIRNDAFAGLASGVNRGTVGTVGGLIAPCAVLNVLAAVKLGQDADTRLKTLAAINIILVTAVSLMVFAGRATVVNLMLLAFVSYYLTGRRMIRVRTLLVGIIFAGAVWFLATSFFGSRETGTVPLRTLANTARAEPQPWLADVVAENNSVGLAAVNVSYYASPIPTLSFYMGRGPWPGPYYGQYTYPLPTRLVGTALGTWDRTDWFNIRTEIYVPMESRGYFGNVWATSLRDLLIDFGFVGAVVFCGLLGAFMAWARNRYETFGALHYHYVEAIACFTFGFGAFTSFMFEPFQAMPFLFAIAAMIYVRGMTASAPAVWRANPRAGSAG